MAFVEAMKTSNKDDWETPPEIFKPLDKEFGFTLDPCCTHQTAKCQKYYTVAEDGLSKSWSGETVFMNPPYGRVIGKWVRKAREEWEKGATVVCLLPARVDTRWFHDHILGKAEIRFIRGRVYFRQNGGEVDRAPFPSMITIYKHKGAK